MLSFLGDDVEIGNNVRVPQRTKNRCLAEKPRHSAGVARKITGQHLDGDDVSGRAVFCAIHRSISAAADLIEDSVAANRRVRAARNRNVFVVVDSGEMAELRATT